MRYFVLFSLCFISACVQVSADASLSADSSNSVQKFDSETAFQPSADAMADVDAALARASERGKLGLVVMGANWCHDSRGFVKTLNNRKLSELVAEKFEIVLVDVGYLDRARNVIERFGMPVIYGTPTVLIVDPDTDLLINRQDMHRWRDAASIDVGEAVDYFTQMATQEARNEAATAQADVTGTLAALYDEIAGFERAQAERIYGGFVVLGPMLAMDRGDRPEEFERYWGQVRDLRYEITDDLAALRQEARDRVAAGEADITLTFPVYPPFDWE